MTQPMFQAMLDQYREFGCLTDDQDAHILAAYGQLRRMVLALRDNDWFIESMDKDIYERLLGLIPETPCPTRRPLSSPSLEEFQ
jgi:hypothetical protein